jgi:hypothetical protein
LETLSTNAAAPTRAPEPPRLRSRQAGGLEQRPAACPDFHDHDLSPKDLCWQKRQEEATVVVRARDSFTTVQAQSRLVGMGDAQGRGHRGGRAGRSVRQRRSKRWQWAQSTQSAASAACSSHGRQGTQPTAVGSRKQSLRLRSPRRFFLSSSLSLAERERTLSLWFWRVRLSEPARGFSVLATDRGGAPPPSL